MSNEIVALRNTVSGQVYEVSDNRAVRILDHPIWGRVNERVSKAKPEVLAQPHVVEDGQRKPIKKEGN